MTPIKRLALWWKELTSLKFTIICLASLMVLVVACTLAQVEMGTYGAVKTFMRSPFVYAALGPWKIPIFPGGGLVGLLLLVNLASSQFSRLELSARKAGLWVIHLGLILLFVGEFVTGFFQVETQMPIAEGATLNYSESPRETELVVIDATHTGFDEVYSIPEPALNRKTEISHPGLPFELHIALKDGAPSLAMMGASEDQARPVAADLTLTKGGQSLGTWSLSSTQPAPETLDFQGRTYRLALRPLRRYLPFSLTLKKFKHEVYPGTDVPSHFSSLVRLADPSRGEDREVLISMNNPLRYGGKAFYQASFDKNDTVSVLQVVENPGWRLPYLACALVAFGLAFHFFARLRGSAGVRSP